MITYEVQSQVTHFWEWFGQNEHRLRQNTNMKSVVEALNNQVLEFGFFSWEIGQGRQKPYYFAISPNGNEQRLQISKAIIEKAPEFRHWEFHYCKPSKQWDFTFEMYDAFMIKQKFKAKKWEYVLLQKKSGNFRILIKAKNMQTLDWDDQQAAGKMVIMNILGEELVMERIDAIEVVTNFAHKHLDYSCDILELEDHVLEILEEEEYEE